MPLCRNGASCTRPDCHFSHTEVACRYKPCLNPTCPYKHEEGQQQEPEEGATLGGFAGHKVWKAGHVSERKFVSEDGGPEEVILPGGGGNAEAQGGAEEMDTAPVDEGVM